MVARRKDSVSQRATVQRQTDSRTDLALFASLLAHGLNLPLTTMALALWISPAGLIGPDQHDLARTPRAFLPMMKNDPRHT